VSINYVASMSRWLLLCSKPPLVLAFGR